MDETKKKTNYFSPDKLIAYSAVLIGLCALVVSVYEANIFRQQQKASVWPFLEFSVTSNSEGFSYNIQNKGVGPAIIKWVVVRIDGTPVKSWRKYGEKILGIDLARTNYVSSFITDRVIAESEEVRIILLKNPDDVRKALFNIDRVSFEICYGSIFQDYWVVTSDSSGTKVRPTVEQDIDSKNTFQD